MKKILWLVLMAASPLASAADEVTEMLDGREPTPFERQFQKIDANRDNAISREEATQANEQLLVANFDKIDANKDKGLDRKEVENFVKNLQATLQAQREDFINKMKAADKNGDGEWTKKELKSAKAKLPALEKNFDAIDADHDQKITEQEIAAYARSGQAK